MEIKDKILQSKKKAFSLTRSYSCPRFSSNDFRKTHRSFRFGLEVKCVRQLFLDNFEVKKTSVQKLTKEVWEREKILSLSGHFGGRSAAFCCCFISGWIIN